MVLSIDILMKLKFNENILKLLTLLIPEHTALIDDSKFTFITVLNRATIIEIISKSIFIIMWKYKEKKMNEAVNEYGI